MSSRLAGAILALTAAALLTLSLLAASWWNGHPAFDGREIEAKTIFVSPLGAQGCNTGGDGSCTSLDMAGSFKFPGYGALGVTGLLGLAALLLAVTTFAGAESRTSLAKAVIGLTIASAVVVVLLIVIGPHLAGSHEVAMHLGTGIYLLGGAFLAAVFGSVLAKRPLPKPELRPSRAAIAPALAAPPPAGAQPVDVLALIQQDDALRPSRPAIAPQSGSSLPGPAGPLAPQNGPLFSAAPQLRALYDADPAQGGTAGYVPGAPPKLPMRGPTPLPHAAVAAVVGLPTPPPIAPSHAMVEGRTKPASVPPPPPPLPPTVPTPPRPRAGTQPPPPGTFAARLKASSVPPPVRAKAPSVVPLPGGPRTIAAAVVPPPSVPRTIAGAVAPPPPAAPVLPKKLPVRAVTDPSDHMETIEREREDEVGDTTDAGVPLPPDIIPPADTEQRPALERPSTDTEDVETQSVEKFARAGSLAETDAVEKMAPEEVQEPRKRPSKPIKANTTDVELIKPPHAIAEPEPAPAPAPAAAPKIPITTAPDSLPPPTEKQAATSGPSPACPQCEAPMAWVEEHLRFYCKSCRMYF